MTLETKAAHRKDLTSGISEMQHRHFATIAAIIREMDRGLVACSTDATRNFVAELFADRLGRTNSNFNRDRFLRACRPE